MTYSLSWRIWGQPLAALDVANELAQAKKGLGDIPVTALASNSSATLNNLGTHLRSGYDILNLICHGALIQGEPWLWLEDESGRTHRVAGGEFVTRLQELQQCPRLVVLASCQSAGVVAALGPRLAEAGIPAVLAMQGNVTMQTVGQFMPVFFQELQRDGQLDRAIAVARGAVRERPDWWMPVLFMRLKSGRIWYAPGFQEQEGLKKWPALLGNIRRGQCTPILGPGLNESLLGSRREIARR
jgi:CHAT domain-containing protein